ncbi:sugar-binding transcriptional regulator [Virgibacillus kimchii]
MRNLINLQKKLLPDLLEVMEERYSVLHAVQLLQPIGRRALAENTNLTERHVRADIEFLQRQGFIQITTKGMFTTKEGEALLEQLRSFFGEIMGLSVLENQIQERLNVEQVIVVAGNSDESEWVKQEMGKACVSYLNKKKTNVRTVAVTGGSTMAAAAEVMKPLQEKPTPVFVPARGGVGERAENQANTIAVEMAKRANGDYRLLYVPDPLSEPAYQSMINEASINETLSLIKSASVVLHGIGDALKMAERRKTPEPIVERLKEQGAVSEAFGYYFDDKGHIVHKVRTIGMQLEDLHKVEEVISIAGGTSKAKAITSYLKKGKSSLLITDEAAAEEMLKNDTL